MKKVVMMMIGLAAIPVMADFTHVASDNEIRVLKNMEVKASESISVRDNHSKGMFSRAFSDNSLSIEQLFAKVLTNTIVNAWAKKSRGKDMGSSLFTRKRESRGNLILEHSAEIIDKRLVSEECRLQLLNEDGEVLVSWKSSSLRNYKYHVSTEDVKMMLESLRRNGFELKKLSMALKNQKKYTKAVSFLKELGIIDEALIGIDSSAKFAKVWISVSETSEKRR